MYSPVIRAPHSPLVIRTLQRKYVESSPSKHLFSVYGRNNTHSIADIGHFIVMVEPRILAYIPPTDPSLNHNISYYVEFESTNNTEYNLSLFSSDLSIRFFTCEIDANTEIIATKNNTFLTIHSVFNHDIAESITRIGIWRVDDYRLVFMRQTAFNIGLHKTLCWMPPMNETTLVIETTNHEHSYWVVDCSNNTAPRLPSGVHLENVACIDPDTLLMTERLGTALSKFVTMDTQTGVTTHFLTVPYSMQLQRLNNSSVISLSTFYHTPEQTFTIIEKQADGFYKIAKSIRISHITNPFTDKLIGMVSHFRPMNACLIAILGTFGIHIWDIQMNRIIRFFSVRNIDRYRFYCLNQSTLVINVIDATLCINVYSNDVDFIIPRLVISKIIQARDNHYITLDTRCDVMRWSSQFGGWNRRKRVLMWYKMAVRTRELRRQEERNKVLPISS